MVIEDLLAKRGMTKYKLAVQAEFRTRRSVIFAAEKQNSKNALPKQSINCRRCWGFLWSS